MGYDTIRFLNKDYLVDSIETVDRPENITTNLETVFERRVYRIPATWKLERTLKATFRATFKGKLRNRPMVLTRDMPEEIVAFFEAKCRVGFPWIVSHDRARHLHAEIYTFMLENALPATYLGMVEELTELNISFRSRWKRALRLRPLRPEPPARKRFAR